jgi:hypothetical protein
MDGGSVYGYLSQGATPPRWYVSDWQELYNFRYPDEAIAVPVGAQPAIVLEHEMNPLFLTVEAMPSAGKTIENIRWVLGLDFARSRKILIYDLEATGLRQ